ncbi:MAG TPA: hypothetical protein VGI08_03395 [Diaminobutyricibacter sp.]|uniref:hypothetical protein n=1 Tax=Leifsonia sp. McL0618 TaxID=3415677 RepID=UPI003372C360
MSDRGTDRDDSLDDFIEAQDGDYEPAPTPFDADDVPVEEEDDELVPDEDRPVPLDLDDAELD